MLAGWWLWTRSQGEDLENLANKEDGLRKEFVLKQSRAVNLPALRTQLDNMKEMLRQMLRQLPSKTEMPDLLVDISQTALASGIGVELFQPGPEKIQNEDFYAERPIQLKMVGTYHQFGTFISGVASLPRVVILTLHDVSLRPVDRVVAPGAKVSPKDGQLVLDGTVKTYRYVDDDEAASLAPPPGTPGAANAPTAKPLPPPPAPSGGH